VSGNGSGKRSLSPPGCAMTGGVAPRGCMERFDAIESTLGDLVELATETQALVRLFGGGKAGKVVKASRKRSK
jgi:hypothetical protein